MQYFTLLYFLTTENVILFLQIFDFTIKSIVIMRDFAAHRLGIPAVYCGTNIFKLYYVLSLLLETQIQVVYFASIICMG
jgi:hypothetical protein